MKKRIINIIIGLLLAVLLIGESVYSFKNMQSSGRRTGETIQLVHNPFESEIASTTVLGLVLEEAGFNVNLISVDNAIMYESIASGESDAMTAAWLPVTHGTTYDEYKDRLDDLGPNLTGAEAGLTVPSYMDVDSIDELEDEDDKTIISIEPGAGITYQTEEAMEVYDNLNDWELESPSTGAMIASLDTAIQNEEDIVVTGWRPLWIFMEYDLKILDDPKEVYGEAEEIHTLARKGLKDDHPEAYEIIDNFEWEVEDMDTVTYDMNKGADDRSAAQNWIDNNRDKVDSWLDGVFDEE